MNIQEDYVSFETAKLLKEKEFKGNCIMDYIDNELMNVYDDDYPSMYELENTGDDVVNAPTLQMAMKWLREIHDIDIMIWVENYNGVKQYVSDCWKNVIQKDINFHRCGRFSSYNEACEAAIKYCLENLI